jgi:leucyl aminopeptidase
MRLSFAEEGAEARPLYLVGAGDLSSLSGPTLAWAQAVGWKAEPGTLLLIPRENKLIGAVFAPGKGRFAVAGAATKLPAGTWRLVGNLDPEAAEEAALGWLLESYRFDRYRAAKPAGARLVCPEGVDRARVERIANAEALTRDLVNTPAGDMGPDELEATFRDLAARFGAQVRVVTGEDLLVQNFPMIHAVGRASARAPRLLDMVWGEEGPHVVLVGKGVCFDTGGLDLKPSSGMLNMKKDMGGAATVMGLAQVLMASGVKLRLRVLVPAVENAVGGNAFRPRDILTSRKGLTVEVNNTDAEGRLVLADALALACEGKPDLVVSMATLTGAARVALGPDLAPYFTDDDALAQALEAAAAKVRDPVWRMPFWEPYESLIDPGIADLDNAPSGGMAGAITAALFLRRFVDVPRYVHFDIFAHQPTAAPGRPKGGVGQGARALFETLQGLMGA